MADRLILHIGTPKSATTYLQGILWKNRGRLAEQGVHLPLHARMDHNHAAGDLTGGAVRTMPGREVTTWDKMVEGIDAVEGTALISEEMLANARDAGIERVRDSLPETPLHIVVTTRDPVRQVPSLWQQTLKTRNTWTLEDFCGRLAADQYQPWSRQQRIVTLLRRWRDIGQVPVDRLTVVTVPQSGAAPGLIWERFASVIGVDPAGFEAPDEHVNTTLDSVQAEVLRQVNILLDNRLDHPDPYVSVVRLQMVPALAEHGGHPRIVLPADMVPWADEFSRETIAGIKEIGVNVVGDLDELIGVPPPTSSQGPPDPDRIREVALATLADMCVASADRTMDFHEMRTKFNRSQRRLGRANDKVEQLQARVETLERRRVLPRAKAVARRVLRRS